MDTCQNGLIGVLLKLFDFASKVSRDLLVAQRYGTWTLEQSPRNARNCAVDFGEVPREATICESSKCRSFPEERFSHGFS